VRSSQRRRKSKVEAFGKLNFFPVLEESVEAQEGAKLSLDGPIDSGPLRISTSRELAGEEMI
jgi:hypothetical protein